MSNVFLPGGNRQAEFLIDQVELDNKSILLLGSESAVIATILSAHSNRLVEIIVEDYDSFMNTNLAMEETSNISVKLMDLEITDYKSSSFDLVYSQGGIPDSRRNKIIKEIKRILKPDGILCVGEMILLKEDVPQFIENIFESSDLSPLTFEKLNKYYTQRKFEIHDQVDLSPTLKNYYKTLKAKLESKILELEEREKSYYKKLLNRISHEANVYLNQGGDKYIGFQTLILKLSASAPLR